MTNAKEFTVNGETVRNPRGRNIQAVMIVVWPVIPEKMIGPFRCFGSKGGRRVETVDARANLAAVVKAAKRHGAISVDVYPV